MVLIQMRCPFIFAVNYSSIKKIKTMKMKLTTFAVVIATVALFASCKKDDKNNSNPSSSNITAGQCTISFDTDKDFNGTTSVSIAASATTSAVRANNNTKDQLTLTAAGYSGTSVSTASLTVYVDAGATTSNGNISADFNSSTSNDVAVLTINRTNGSGSSAAYSSKTGTVTITKLTTSEVEGTFSCNAVNESSNTSINVSNGKFAGKFK